MSTLQRKFLDQSLRSDLITFIHRSFQQVSPACEYHHNWHIEAISWHLEQCANGNIKRLIITLPPRQLKSIAASVAFPAWVLGRDPSRRIVCASYGADLAGKHARDCRAVMESPWYKSVFRDTRISRDKNKELDFATTRQGYRHSTSVGGTLTGRGGSLIIVDDPIKPDDAMSRAIRSSVNEWFDRTLYTRLDDKRNDAIVIIMQRLHMEDLVGHVTSKDEPWVHLSLPAIAEIETEIPIGPGQTYVRRAGDLLHPERESKEVLDAIKSMLGSFHFSAQYQQSPVPEDGEVIKWTWFKSYEERPPQEGYDCVVQSWDTAYKAEEQSDYSVCTTWFVKRNNYYLLDVLRERLLYPELRRRVLEHAQAWKAESVLIEDAASGTSVTQDLAEDEATGAIDIIAVEPEGDKFTRMSARSAMIEAGHVHIPTRAPWLEDFRAELLQFPKGRYDDQVDSLSQFLNWAKTQWNEGECPLTWVSLR